MAVWFEGSGPIECTIAQVEAALEDYGKLFVGVVTRMPGITSVELVEQGSDYVTVRTNEGLMKRTGISGRVQDARVVVEYDEEYEAGSKVTTRAHFLDEFTTTGTGVEHHVVISGMEAPGFLGFLYRRLGSSSMGKAFLRSYQGHFEDQGA